MTFTLSDPRAFRPEASQALALWTATAAHAAAVVTVPGVPGVSHLVTEGLMAAYTGSGTLAGGLLTVACGGVTVFQTSIDAKGQVVVPWRGGTSPGDALVVTLADGGANVTGYVNLLGYAAGGTALPGTSAGFDFRDFMNSWLLGVL